MFRFVAAVFLLTGVICLDKNETTSPKLKKGDLLKPLTDKIDSFVTLIHHPNFGGFQLLNPVNLWEKLHEKASSYFNGPLGSIYGVAAHGQHDYPFAYRKTDR